MNLDFDTSVFQIRWKFFLSYIDFNVETSTPLFGRINFNVCQMQYTVRDMIFVSSGNELRRILSVR